MYLFSAMQKQKMSYEEYTLLSLPGYLNRLCLAERSIPPVRFLWKKGKGFMPD